MESTTNFQHFEKKDQLIAQLYLILHITGSERSCYLNVLKVMF